MQNRRQLIQSQLFALNGQIGLPIPSDVKPSDECGRRGCQTRYATAYQRLWGLPAEMREELKEARNKKGWSQRELGRHLGLPQMHVSGIESGKIVPRFDTLLDYVRELDYDLVLVPRSLVPAVLALIRQYEASNEPGGEEERSLYSVSEDEQEEKERRSDEI